MSIFIGADIVPVTTNIDLFEKAQIELLTQTSHKAF